MNSSTFRVATQSLHESRPFLALLGAATSCLVLAACSAPAPAPPMVEGDPLGTLGAHEHGVARLGLAVDGSRITMDLKIPAESVYGFEHGPRSDDERETATAALDGLHSGVSRLMMLPPEASCTLEATEVDAPDVHGEADGHGEVHLSSTFNCSQVPAGVVRLAFASVLPDVEQVDLTIVTSRGQAAARVAPDASFTF